MDLIRKLISNLATPAANPMMPVQRLTRKERAMEYVGPSHLSTADREVPLFRINHRRLERNKYAPWGRGDLAGALN